MLVTTGSQVADLAVGSITEAPRSQASGRSWGLWKRLAQGRANFGNPAVFFDAAKAPDRRWVTFTVTTKGTEFIDQMTKLTWSEPGSGGLVTLKDPALLSLTIFDQPEVIDQPDGTYVWWGYGLHPEDHGDFVKKRMAECSGEQILEEVVKQMRFDKQLGAIMGSSVCIPCDMLYVNNIWMPRRRVDRPRPVPEGRPISDLLASTWRLSRTWRSPSNTPPARRGKRFASCSGAVPRRRPFIRASPIPRRCSLR